jgi:hypothetical protein
MPEIVFALCVVTSALCLVLLVRQYRRRRTRLLFWSAVCFAGLAANNLLLFLDLVVFPGPAIDLSLWRTLTALVGLAALVYGLVQESE